MASLRRLVLVTLFDKLGFQTFSLRVVIHRAWLLALAIVADLQGWLLLILLILLFLSLGHIFLVLAAGEVLAAAIQLLLLLLAFFVLRNDVDLPDEELRPAHLNDVTGLQDVDATLSSSLLTALLVGLRLDDKVHSLTHVIGRECLDTLVIITGLKIACFYLFSVLVVLCVQQLISDRCSQDESVAQILDLEQKLGLLIKSVGDDGARFHELAIKILANEKARLGSQ